MKINVSLTILVLWYWLTGSRVAVTAGSINISKNTVVQVYRYIKDIISWKLINEEQFLLGGVGHMVQIDDSVITKWKYSRGTVVAERWVMDIYDTNRKKGFIQYLPNRSATTLENFIKQHVRTSSGIWTDKWPGYNNLSKFGYVHKTFNESYNFVDPTTGACTNQIEGYWSNLKKFLRRLGVMSSPFLPEYIDQYLWEQCYGKSVAYFPKILRMCLRR